MYTSLETDKDCDLLPNGPVLPTGSTPHDKQNRNCLDYSPKSGHESQKGSMPRREDGRTDRQTDRQLQSDSHPDADSDVSQQKLTSLSVICRRGNSFVCTRERF